MKKITFLFSIILLVTQFRVSAQGATCGAASSLTVNASCTNTAFSFSGSNSISNPSCVGAALYDAWYSFVATATTTNIELTGPSKDAAIAVYSDCSGTLIGGSNCANAGGSGVDESLVLTTVAGVTYYVRVLRVGSSGGGSMTGNICAYSIPSSTNCDYTLNMIDSYGDGWNGASIDVEENSSNIGNHTFTTGYNSSSTITISNGASVDLIFNSGTFDSEVSWNIVDPFGNVVCSGNGSTTGIVCSFTANCTGPDTPCVASFLTPQGSVCGTALTYDTYNNNSSTDSGIANPGCGNYGGADVWFSAVVPASGGFDVLTQANGLTDMAMAVYSGPCTSPSLISCSSNGNGNMPTDIVSGLNPGDTVLIRVWDEGGNATGTFNIALDDPNPTYCLNGTATPTGVDDCVQLTEATNGQGGCAWSATPFDLTANIDVEFSVNVGSDDGGADGVTFVIQNTGNGASESCGATGGGIGAQGLTPSVIIEFDTWCNGYGDSGNWAWEPTYDHIAVEIDGTLIQDQAASLNNAPYAGPVQASSTTGDIEDGLDHAVQITWNAGTQVMEIYFDGVLRLSFTIDLVSLFGGTEAYWGFTASTGGFNNEQSFCPGTLPGFALGVNTISYGAQCDANKTTINWKTQDEENMMEYILEKTLDGVNFSALQSMSALNGSSNSYSYTDQSANATNAYYRIKSVDIYNNIDVVSSLLSSPCSSIDGGTLNVTESDKQAVISFESNYRQDYTLKIHDIRGRVIWTNSSVSEKGRNNIQVDLSQFSSSMYIVSYTDEQSAISKKFILK